MRAKLLSALCAASFVLAGPAQSGNLVMRTDPGSDKNCKEVPPKPDEDGDFLLRVCTTPFGVKRWMIIHEAVRFNEGFGTVENLPYFIATGFLDTPYEWWGEMKSGVFKPKAVIKRYQFGDLDTPPKKYSQLVVFRLLADGKSCVVGFAKTNRQAREFVKVNSPCGGLD